MDGWISRLQIASKKKEAAEINQDSVCLTMGRIFLIFLINHGSFKGVA
jgi:hypothetical protein